MLDDVKQYVAVWHGIKATPCEQKKTAKEKALNCHQANIFLHHDVLMELNTNVLGQRIGQFKQHLSELGFISPVLGELEPMRNVPESTNRQEVLGLVLEGDLALKSEGETTNYLMGELFFIDKVTRFELQAGPSGVKYLFAFK